VLALARAWRFESSPGHHRAQRGRNLTHVRIWKFHPPEGREGEFEAAYCEIGDWAQLFRHAPGFLGTTLLRPLEPGGWWLTIDRWDSQANFDAFTEVFGDQYRALDAELEGVAGEEVFVGAFDETA
jgi:heme-degrading monooxygenase HmoA